MEKDCCRWEGVEDYEFGKGTSVGSWEEVEIDEDEVVEDWEEFVAMMLALIPTQWYCLKGKTYFIYW